MRSVLPTSNPRPTPVLPRPAYLVRLTPDGLDACTSNSVLQGLGVSLQGPWEGSDDQRSVKVNCRATRILYGWLNQRDVLIKADKQERLVVLGMAAETARRTV